MELGKIIGEKYRVVEVLGQGGTSIVVLAEHLALNNLWAIKVLSKSSPWFSYEMQEINMLKGLNHPMLPRIADVVEDADFYYIVMDYIPGTNLLDYTRMNGKIQEKILFKWTKEILEVLSYLHGRTPPVIYRDLKPANLIVDENGRIRLVDFGTARFNHEASTEDTLYIGTQGYAAPEQYGLGKSDARTDLFNLGMTLVHLATGLHPTKLNKLSIRPALKQAGLSARYIRLILEMIQTDPDERPINCEDALKKLEKTNQTKSLFYGNKLMNGELKCVVAVSSILAGSGVTSFCMMLGLFFSKRGFKTALAEINPSLDFERLREVMEGMGNIKSRDGHHFELEGITFYPSVPESSQIPRKGFDIVILDLGILQNERGVRELNRADIKLVICPKTLWKFPRIPDFIERLGSFAQEEWIYVLTSSQKYQGQILTKQYQLEPLVVFPSLQDPFFILKEEEKSIGYALQQVFRHTGLNIRL